MWLINTLSFLDTFRHLREKVTTLDTCYVVLESFLTHSWTDSML